MKMRTDARTVELISPLNKGLGPMDRALTFSEIPDLGWQLLHEDLSLPTAVLYEDKLAHNLQWMQEFVAAYGIRLAPHGKTTMAPKLGRIGRRRRSHWSTRSATAKRAAVSLTPLARSHFFMRR
jgi:D-serine dehydratase